MHCPATRHEVASHDASNRKSISSLYYLGQSRALTVSGRPDPEVSEPLHAWHVAVPAIPCHLCQCLRPSTRHTTQKHSHNPSYAGATPPQPSEPAMLYLYPAFVVLLASVTSTPRCTAPGARQLVPGSHPHSSMRMRQTWLLQQQTCMQSNCINWNHPKHGNTACSAINSSMHPIYCTATHSRHVPAACGQPCGPLLPIPTTCYNLQLGALRAPPMVSNMQLHALHRRHEGAPGRLAGGLPAT